MARTNPARPGGREVMNEMLHPGVIGVAGGRHAELPAGVFAQTVAAPVAHVEGRIGQDVIGLEVFVQVALEAVGGFEAEIAFDAADGEVHSRQPPRRGIAFLSEDADVAFGLAAVSVSVRVGFHEFNRLHEHAA